MSRARWIVSQVWPRLAIIAAVVGVWALVSATGFYTKLVLPSPLDAWNSLRAHIADGTIQEAGLKSLTRLALGFGFSLVAGTVIGLAMAASQFVQRSVGSLMAGLQSLPSISWIPLAILWFGIARGAILFVVIIGALPAIAIATASAVRQVPPLLIRAGRTLGARSWRLSLRVIFPAALPAYVGGLQQGWAFAWRALMAGELIAGASSSAGLGQKLEFAQNNLDSAQLLAVMIVIVLIGMIVDLLIFGVLDRRIRSRRGLIVTT